MCLVRLKKLVLKLLLKTKQTLDYIHSNLWDPSKVPSHGGVRYFMSIIDYYSRNVWIYILKNKSDTFNKFKEYKILIENQVGRNVKRLKTNNGLEYLSTKFNEFCNKEGIIRHNIVRKNP